MAWNLDPGFAEVVGYELVPNHSAAGQLPAWAFGSGFNVGLFKRKTVEGEL